MHTTVTRLIPLALAALLAGVVPAFAQAGGGVKGGVTFSKFGTNPDSGGALDRLVDWTAGGFFVATDRPLTVQVDTLAARRGAKLDTDVLGLLFDFGGFPNPGDFLGELVSLRASYLDVSGLMRVQSGPRGSVVYGLAGPTIGFRLGARLKVLGFEQDVDSLVRDVDLGLTVGAGVETGHVLLEGRYTHGLTNVLPDAVETITGASVKHRTLALLAGLRF